MVMRKLELPLNQTQKVRFERAMERLQSPSESVIVADSIPVNHEDALLKYKPEVGDIVVGRVIEVAQTRWRVDLNFTQDSFINLPDDNVQKRRTSVDELNMRNIYAEDDVVCAEVGSFKKDGSLLLRVRS